MKRSNKSPEMEKFLDDFSLEHFGRSRKHSIENNICVFCGKKAEQFNDPQSVAEFSISGLCQSCQIEVFGR